MNWSPEDWGRLGTLLREAREAQGLSRRALAEKASISEKAIQTAEEGREPSARWPKSVDAMASTLGWAPGSARSVLDGGTPAARVEQRPAVDALARRMADNQVRMAADDVRRDAERLAADARHYADSLKSGNLANSGMASRLAQEAADLARRASRLDGMRDMAALIEDA